MFGFLSYANKLPPLSAFPLKSYKINFSLDRLVPGVDNIRHDVLLSPTFVASTRKLVSLLIVRHAEIKDKSLETQEVSWAKEVENYKQFYKELMSDALNKGKARRENQVEYLAQTAVVKMLLEEVCSQYDHLIGSLKKSLRKSDLTGQRDRDETPKMKDQLQLVLQDRETIIQRVGLEICSYWTEVEIKDLRNMRESIFGNRSTFFMDVIGTPILHVQHPENEIFILSEYDIALGRRIEDPDKFDNVLFLIRDLINQIYLKDPSAEGGAVDQRLASSNLHESETAENDPKAHIRKIDEWIRYLGNMDTLFDWQGTKTEIQVLKKQKGDPKEIGRLKRLLRHQKLALHFFYKRFRKKGVLERVSASYEMQPEYKEFCPPLVPQQIMQYLIYPRSRRVIKNRLRRLSQVYSRPFSLAPLNKKIKSMEQMTIRRRKNYLVRFMKAFAHYQRDLSICGIMKEAIERINIATEEKTITLSRENNTLFEFLLSHEQDTSQTPIINHVVIKADVRGSTDITHIMNERGLNPASHFSLNFFDPISEILAEYDAAKIFIEGDAIILSIFERENAPSGWYSVARACGIAINMLIIIQRYNKKNRENQLPILELGVGISHMNKSPTFLFDGNNRIMISPAINHADRLSSCAKACRKLIAAKKGPFNLYVFQTHSEQEIAATKDDLNLRYNVNGIELSPIGFEKLSNEIDLKVLTTDLKDIFGQKSTLYFGKFPTKSGRYQRIIIRESQIPKVDPDTLKKKDFSAHKYYEVCTNPKLYKKVSSL